jgi:predicted membrane channel-forming protein YqfA (hemolysin III family)
LVIDTVVCLTRFKRKTVPGEYRMPPIASSHRLELGRTDANESYRLRFHAIWHGFVLLAASCHYSAASPACR